MYDYSYLMSAIKEKYLCTFGFCFLHCVWRRVGDVASLDKDQCHPSPIAARHNKQGISGN